jgi:hypothetical protein
MPLAIYQVMNVSEETQIPRSFLLLERKIFSSPSLAKKTLSAASLFHS